MSSTATIYRRCPCGESAHKWTGRSFYSDGQERETRDTPDHEKIATREFACRNCRRTIRSKERIYYRLVRALGLAR